MSPPASDFEFSRVNSRHFCGVVTRFTPLKADVLELVVDSWAAKLGSRLRGSLCEGARFGAHSVRLAFNIIHILQKMMGQKPKASGN